MRCNMSAYIQFFIRGVDDTFYPIGTYSRNSVTYEMFSEYLFEVWECIVPVTDELLNKVMVEVRIKTDNFYDRIKSLNKKIEEVRKLENVSVKDKMSSIEDYMSMEKEYRDRIEELEHCSIFISLLRDMLDEAEDTKYYDEIKTIDRNNYIYVGIEVGIPTINNIKE